MLYNIDLPQPTHSAQNPLFGRGKRERSSLPLFSHTYHFFSKKPPVPTILEAVEKVSPVSAKKYQKDSELNDIFTRPTSMNKQNFSDNELPFLKSTKAEEKGIMSSPSSGTISSPLSKKKSKSKTKMVVEKEAAMGERLSNYGRSTLPQHNTLSAANTPLPQIPNEIPTSFHKNIQTLPPQHSTSHIHQQYFLQQQHYLQLQALKCQQKLMKQLNCRPSSGSSVSKWLPSASSTSTKKFSFDSQQNPLNNEFLSPFNNLRNNKIVDTSVRNLSASFNTNILNTINNSNYHTYQRSSSLQTDKRLNTHTLQANFRMNDSSKRFQPSPHLFPKHHTNPQHLLANNFEYESEILSEPCFNKNLVAHSRDATYTGNKVSRLLFNRQHSLNDELDRANDLESTFNEVFNNHNFNNNLNNNNNNKFSERFARLTHTPVMSVAPFNHVNTSNNQNLHDTSMHNTDLNTLDNNQSRGANDSRSDKRTAQDGSSKNKSGHERENAYLCK